MFFIVKLKNPFVGFYFYSLLAVESDLTLAEVK